MGALFFSTTRLLNTQTETLLVSIAKAETITSEKNPNQFIPNHLVGTLPVPDVQNQNTIHKES